MYEIRAARQPEIPTERQGYRRLFADEHFTLHVWYDRKGGSITEFHVYYGMTRDRRLSWSAGRPTRDGEATEHGFWGRDGLHLPASFDLERFTAAVATIDPQVRAYVLARISPPR